MGTSGGVVVALCLVAVVVMATIGGEATLTTDFYDDSCPEIYSIVEAEVDKAVASEARLAASLLRLHFHDCFVNGCDGSVLLDNVTNPDGSLLFETEKDSLANVNSVRGFPVIDAIKAALEDACPQTVSCADILAITARDSAVAAGLMPKYPVFFGRRDSLTANINASNQFLPAPNFTYANLTQNFANVGLNELDLAALSGAHTIGRVKCAIVRRFSIGDTDINSGFRDFLNTTVCPPGSQNPTSGTPGNLTFPLTDLDLVTPDTFDTNYYKNIRNGEGLMPSDQTLQATPGVNQAFVAEFAANSRQFFRQFSLSMIKMGNISPLEGDDGEIRLNCRQPNSDSVLLKSRVASQ
jgi:peroxidase